MSSLMMKEAFDDVKRGVAIRKAARIHGLPESTLRLRLSSGQPVAKMGAPTIFTRQQEEQLANHCIKLAHIGYGYTRWQIMDMAKNMCDVTGKEVYDGPDAASHLYRFVVLEQLNGTIESSTEVREILNLQTYIIDNNLQEVGKFDLSSK